jgi:hypothetical protein
MRRVTCITSTDAIREKTAVGSKRHAASSGLCPCTDWKYWLRKKRRANAANETSVIDTLAPVKDKFLKNLIGSMGWSERFSHHAKTASIATPTLSVTMTKPAVQLSSPALMMP